MSQQSLLEPNVEGATEHDFYGFIEMLKLRGPLSMVFEAAPVMMQEAPRA